MSDFQDKVAGIVRNNGLDHHSNTSNNAEIDALKNQYLQTVMSAFLLPATTEGELLSEMDATLVDIYTKYALKLQVTHEMRTAISDIQTLIEGGNATKFIPKYRLFSAHDSNVATWLV